MEYRTKHEGRYRRSGDTRESIRDTGHGVTKHRSLHSPEDSPKFKGDRTRYALDVTYDYRNVYGWNSKGKKKGC